MDERRHCLMKWVLALVFSTLVTLPAIAGDECTAVYGTGTRMVNGQTFFALCFGH